MRGLVLRCIVFVDKFPSGDWMSFSNFGNDIVKQYGLVPEKNP